MDVKTVDSSNNYIVDAVSQRQKETLSKMRESAMALSDGCYSARQAIQEITGMRIYHQLMRIVKYTELMDKLEAKLYDSIDYAIENSNSSDTSTWVTLLGIQKELQKTMIESHKLLQPYLDIQELAIVDVAKPDTDTESSVSIMNSEDRDRLRMNAYSVIKQLQLSGGDSDAG